MLVFYSVVENYNKELNVFGFYVIIKGLYYFLVVIDFWEVV